MENEINNIEEAENHNIENQNNAIAETVLENTNNLIEASNKEIDITELVSNENHDEDNELPVEEHVEEASEINDYSELSKAELVEKTKELLSNEDISSIKVKIEAIRSCFYKLHRTEIEEKKKQLATEGEEVESFDFTKDELENEFKELYKKYKELKTDQLKKAELQKEENLKVKYQIIDEIKELVKREESIDKTFKDFRELQRKWKDAGPVPQSSLKDLWENYHFNVENFYNYIKINQELRDLDLKKNLETKLEICEKTEELFIEPSIKKAAEKLQEYHNIWRETGPVPVDKKDDIWQRFKEATSQINKKHQEFYLNLKTEQENNFHAKEQICIKAEEITEKNPENVKDWESLTNEILNLQQIWKSIGFAPKKQNTEIYIRFKTTVDSFFNKKKEFYKSLKEKLNENLQKKIDICALAESLQDSIDWKETTRELINLQAEWKKIGTVPRKNSDEVWKRFRAACDHFFTKKSEYFANIDKNLEQNLALKEELISKVENFQPQEDIRQSLETLKQFQKSWTEIGHVPLKLKDEMHNRFRNAINKKFEELKIDDKKKNIFLFKQKLENIKEKPKSGNKINTEREKLIKRIKQLETDITLLENNIGFFSKSEKSDSLVAEIRIKIENSKKQLETLMEQIRIIDSM